MNKYIKPTISLLSLNTTSGAASSCSTSKADATELMDLLKAMGYSDTNAFGMVEGCKEPVLIDDYCKFTSSIQVFFS